MPAEVNPALGLQASLEEAAAQLIRTDLLYPESQCDCQFDGRPPATAGDVFVSVWSENERESHERNSLAESMGVNVTLTLRLKTPRDRWLIARRDLEARLNAIRALLHQDIRDHRVIRKANELAGRGTGEQRHVGFQAALMFAGFERLKVVTAEWFGATGAGSAGLAQTAKFKDARCIQAISTAR